MQQSRKVIAESRKQILQKDLSFSNQIFQKHFNPETLKSNKSSQSNIAKNIIPPLVKYTEENTEKQNVSVSEYANVKQKQNSSGIDSKERQLNLFSRTKKFGDNFNFEDQTDSQTNFPVPTLSKLEQMILKKYQKSSENNSNQKVHKQLDSRNLQLDNKDTKIHFQKEDYTGIKQNYFSNPANMDSLEESRIANQTIEKQNNWVLNGLTDNSSINDGSSLLEQKGENQKMFALNNNSFRKTNALNLIPNSLHISQLPEFIEDDSDLENNLDLNTKDGQFSTKFDKSGQGNIHEKLKIFASKTNPNNNLITNGNKVNNLKQKSIKQITMNLFNFYIGQHFQNDNFQMINQDKTQKSSNHDSMLINDEQDVSHDTFTIKSTPIYKSKRSRQLSPQNKSISQTDQQVKNLSFSQYSQSVKHQNQHFINDKDSNQIIGSILNDSSKMKLFLKYLQCQIAQNSQNTTLCQNYDLLSCILMKIKQITEKNSKNDSTKILTHSILQLFASRKKQSSSLDSPARCFRPQIIRSNNKITIDFDPYLTYQKNILTERIAYLKKCLQQKNKQTELVKLTYDGVIHNYAVSLQNLAKRAQNHQKGQEKQLEQEKQQSFYENKSTYSQNIEGKNHLDVIKLNRGSLQGNKRGSFEGTKIHRKATFGKVPSSFRGSAAVDS